MNNVPLPSDDDYVDIRAYYDEAHDNYRGGRYAEALEQFVWLWKNIPLQRQGFGAVRTSFLASDMKKLIDVYPPAKDRITALRDELDPHLEHPGRDELHKDWFVLNEVLGGSDKTLDWFDDMKNSVDGQKVVGGEFRRVAELLRKHDRQAELMAYFPDVEGEIRRWFGEAEKHLHFGRIDGRFIISRLSDLYVALLSAARNKEAEELEARLIRFYGDLARIDLAQTAIDYELVTVSHLQMLQEVDGIAAGHVRDKIKSMLELND